MVWTATRRMGAGAVALLCTCLVGLAGCGPSNAAGGGDGGEAGTAGMKTCQRTCETAADCGPNTDRWSCESGHCRSETDFENTCSTDGDCWARFSNWQQTKCEESGCGMGRVCVELQGKDYCATERDTDGCRIGSPYDAPLADGSGMVEVCANQDYTCDDGLCREPCESADDCRGDRICNEDTGRCECTRDADCSGDLVCNQSSGDCICRTDAHCSGEGADTCYDGTCGCSGDSACSSVGDSYACAPPPK